MEGLPLVVEVYVEWYLSLVESLTLVVQVATDQASSAEGDLCLIIILNMLNDMFCSCG